MIITLCIAALLMACIGVATVWPVMRPLLFLHRAARAATLSDVKPSTAPRLRQELEGLAIAVKPIKPIVAWLQNRVNQLQIANFFPLGQEHRLHKFLEALPVGIIVITAAGKSTYLNRSGRQLLGLDPTGPLPDRLSELFQIYDANTNAPYPEADLPGLRSLRGETVHADDLLLRRQGQEIALEAWATPIFDDWGTIAYSVTAFQDISDRRRAETQLRHNALHDALTDLPNRSLLMQRLQFSIPEADQSSADQFAVLFIDLDNFKLINDSFGHSVGDQMLVSVAQLLQGLVRDSDLVARFGGDEFVILLEAISGLKDAIAIAERIVLELRSPLLVAGHELFITASIGIVLGQAYRDASDLLRDADIALYQAKGQGRNRYAIFDVEMHSQAIAIMTLERDLRRGIQQQEFRLHYQPIVALKDRHLVGFEALVRWQSSSGDLVFPGEFISVAEDRGLIVAIDFESIRIACRQLARWQRRYPHLALTTGINLSVHDIRNPYLIEHITQVLSETGLSAEALTLEITESVLLDLNDFNRLLPLRDKGVRIAIDDFGTGYSSLSYLCWLPVDLLKIDQSFVKQMQRDYKSQMIVQTVISLGHQLGVAVVAEGVETEEQRTMLQTLGCQFGQGHLFAPALTDDAVDALISDCSKGGSVFL